MVTRRMRVFMGITVLALVLGFWGLPAYQDHLSARLCQAATAGEVAKAEQLLAWGANIDTLKTGNPPLFLAIRAHQVEMVKHLLAHGANLNPELSPGVPVSAISYAAAVGDIPSFAALAEHMGLGKNEQLPQAVGAASPSLTARLLDAGADPNLHDANGKTALHYANDPEVIKLLLAHHAQVNALDNDGRSPLFEMAHLDKPLPCVQALLDGGARVDIAGSDGSTLLHAVAPYGTNTEMAELLIAHGAKVNAPNHDGLTPLHLAAEFSDTSEMVSLLLDHDADVNARDKAGNTPLHHLAAREIADIKVLKVLLAHGADLTIKNAKGLTPLALAEADHHTNVIAQLKKMGATE